jgi:hypothetical protein
MIVIIEVSDQNIMSSVNEINFSVKIDEYSTEKHEKIDHLVDKARPVYFYRKKEIPGGNIYICNTNVDNGDNGSTFRNKLYHLAVSFSREITIDKILK